MAGLKIYNGTSFVDVTPQICESNGTFTAPTQIQIYDGSAWQLVWPAVTFNPPVGSYDQSGSTTASFSFVCNQTAKWTYLMSGSTAYLTRNPSPGGTGSTLLFSLSTTANGGGTAVTISNLQAIVNGQAYGPWTLTMSTLGNNG